MINIEESFNYFLTALSRLDYDKLNLNDELLSYEIFEELDIENTSYLHEWTVDRLIQGKLIPEELRVRILKLREVISELLERKHSIEEYRCDPDWAQIRKEANLILDTIRKHSTK